MVFSTCAMCWTGFGLQANIVEEYVLWSAFLHTFLGLKRTWDQKLSSGLTSGQLNVAITDLMLPTHMTILGANAMGLCGVGPCRRPSGSSMRRAGSQWTWPAEWKIGTPNTLFPRWLAGVRMGVWLSCQVLFEEVFGTCQLHPHVWTPDGAPAQCRPLSE